MFMQYICTVLRLYLANSYQHLCIQYINCELVHVPKHRSCPLSFLTANIHVYFPIVDTLVYSSAVSVILRFHCIPHPHPCMKG